MSPSKLTQERVPYWRNDLRTELKTIAKCSLHNYYGIEGLSLGLHVIHIDPPGYVSKEDYFKMSSKERSTCRDPYRPGPAMERQRFDELVEHECRFGRISRMADEDRQVSGVDLLGDNSWPFCRDCLLPFATMLNGHPRLGYWVNRIEDADELCEACWLTQHYAGDRQKMIQHVLAQDFGGAVMRQSVRVGLRRGWGDDTLIYQNVRDYWMSPGLFELLRLHRVSMSESAGVILSMLETLIAEVRVDERERKQQRDARRAAIWREERMSA
ncbi:MAG TPA: hypothetical protein VN867_05940 [Candidatus Binataceae bacterium]|nr:hypothetical protein [Candidatus Binataceae bacterium]